MVRRFSVLPAGFGCYMILRLKDNLMRALYLGLALVFLGFGARWAGGCTSGHGIGGTLQLAVSSWISAVCFFIGGILMAQVLFKIIG